MNKKQAEKLFDEFYDRDKRSRIELGQPLQEVRQGLKQSWRERFSGRSSLRS